MLDFFIRCLNAEYVHTENAGDYAIEVEEDTVYLLFQWSNGKEDWKNNFDFPAEAYKDGDSVWYCHGGFKKVWKSIRAMLEPRVLATLKAHPEIVKIVCIGYSHGGPMAGFATEDMEYIYGSSYSVEGYAFGCPRFVFGILPREVKKRFKHLTVVRNIPDLVTHVPPVLFGFRHVGKMLKVGSLRTGCIEAHRPQSYTEQLQEQQYKI